MTPTGNYVGQNAPDPVLVAPVAAVEHAGLLEARVATLEAENARLQAEVDAVRVALGERIAYWSALPSHGPEKDALLRGTVWGLDYALALLGGAR